MSNLIQNGSNLYPDQTSHRWHLKGQERAEAYIQTRRLKKIDETAREVLIIALMVLFTYAMFL